MTPVPARNHHLCPPARVLLAGLLRVRWCLFLGLLWTSCGAAALLPGRLGGLGETLRGRGTGSHEGMRGCGGPDGTRQWEGTRGMCQGLGARRLQGDRRHLEGLRQWEALRNWMSEAINSPWVAALFLSCSGASPQPLPCLWQKPQQEWGHCRGAQAGLAGVKEGKAPMLGDSTRFALCRIPKACHWGFFKCIACL